MILEETYGNWSIVLGLVLLTLFLLTKYIPMRTKIEKRSGGVFMAFIVALFAEMYGFPLTIYLLSSYLGIGIPFSHEGGHLLGDLITYLGLGNGWLIVMVISSVLLVVGTGLIVNGWRKVYHSEGENLVTAGIYSKMRHPQYTGIFLITLGFLVQWPTLITLLMWPILWKLYYDLAKKEEKDLGEKFGREYKEYKKRTPSMFLPSFALSSRSFSFVPFKETSGNIDIVEKRT